MNFKLKKPCEHCPFRLDVPPYLRGDRAHEIARSLDGGGQFPCHKTTVSDPDDESEKMAGPKSQFCAGALLCLRDEPNQIMRIAERLGEFRPELLDDSRARVARGLTEFVRHHSGEQDDAAAETTCSISDYGCEAPAGWLDGGVVVTGEVECEGTCPECGEPVCESCMGGEEACPNCIVS